MIAIISAPLSRPQVPSRPLCVHIITYIFYKSSDKIKKYFPDFCYIRRYTKIIFIFSYSKIRIDGPVPTPAAVDAIER